MTMHRPSTPISRRRRPPLLLLVALLTSAMHPGSAAAQTATPSTEAWLDVRVNGAPVGTALVHRIGGQRVWVSHADTVAWRLALPAEPTQMFDGQPYDALDQVPTLVYRVDEARQILWIDAPPALFDTTRLEGSHHRRITPSPSAFGAYLNYDASLSRTQGSSTSSNALLELGGFGPRGSLTNSVLVGQPAAGGTQTLRLESTWTSDQPARTSSLRIGDAISGASDWARSVRFGGVQWATDFSTQPSLITYPLPSLAGTAATPSTVDLYVNNALRLQRDVPAGPFDIRDLPVVTGQGNLQLVVRDLLGQEQVITQPFNTGSGLLANGLRSYSYEVGFERRNYGLISNDYGKPLFSGTERRGLSDTLTGELHAEAMPGQYALGASGTWLLSTLGIAHLAFAGSHSEIGAGATVSAGFEHQGTLFSYGVNGQWRTNHFLQLGYDANDPPPKRTETAYMAVGMRRAGSITVNYTREDLADQPSVRLAGATYNLPLGRAGYLSASAMRFLRGGDGTVFSLNYTLILGPRDAVNSSGHSQAGTSGGALGYRHSLPVDNGVGYGVQAGLSPDDASRADVELQNDSGLYSLETARIGGVDALRATARGSLVLLGGRVYASRYLDEGFAAVSVPGFSNVRIYADNQPIATTDANGYALVPRLRPYQDNPIRIEQADLPMDVRIDTLQLDAIPSRNSGVTLTFPVTRVRSALLTLVFADGRVVPAGAEVVLAGHDDRFPVGERGEVYLTEVENQNLLRVYYGNSTCTVAFAPPPGSDPLPRVGPLICQPQATR
jgi:outer membrane usher protein